MSMDNGQKQNIVDKFFEHEKKCSVCSWRSSIRNYQNVLLEAGDFCAVEGVKLSDQDFREVVMEICRRISIDEPILYTIAKLGGCPHRKTELGTWNQRMCRRCQNTLIAEMFGMDEDEDEIACTRLSDLLDFFFDAKHEPLFDAALGEFETKMYGLYRERRDRQNKE